jgi:hypothetical protein
VDAPGGCGQRPGGAAQLAVLDPPVEVDALDEALSFDDDDDDEDEALSFDDEDDELSDDVAAFRLSVR